MMQGTILSTLARQPTETMPKKRDYTKIKAKFNAMFNNRQKYISRWKDIRDYQLPFLGVFDDEQDQSKVHTDKINNGVAWESCQIFASGVMSGMTPPSRKWFKLTLENAELAANSKVAEVLDDREQILYAVFAKSNFYNTVHQTYMELPFGQSPMSIMPDAKVGVRFTSFPIGTYALECGSNGDVNTFGRKYRMTADQLVEEFGYNACPDKVKRAFDDGKGNASTFVVCWLVMPNKDRNGKLGNKNMPYSSIYWVEGSNTDEILRHSGFEEWAIPIARHTTHDLSGYGKGCAWFAQSDAQMLQLLEKDLVTAIELGIKPPMSASSGVIGSVNLFPGGVTEVDTNEKVEPIFNVGIDVANVQAKIQFVSESIKRAYSADLFLMLDNLDAGQMTAREVMERTQEKMQQLGPVVERLQSEFLNPIIERTYGILDRAGIFPPIDDDVAEMLNGLDVKIEYISPLAQAQKMSSLVNIEQYYAFIMSLAQGNANIVQKFNFEEAADIYGVNLGVPIKVIRSNDEYKEIMEKQQQAQQEQEEQAQALQMAQLAPQMAGAAKQATDAANDGNPVMQQLMGMGV